ncbi:PIN domain-containing protein [Brevibacterium epidermidis]|uniref:PIN domain-containing protein n=1 Tax=Brevibacterium epidermidis TaxID=1698 RepID=UPI000BF94304|nr:PIN domain-containing protein [Brevibacterium epidermidis]
MYKAVLDTCVLVPGIQRDFLLQLAAEGAFAPLWSSGVLNELLDVLNRIDEKKNRSARGNRHAVLVRRMSGAFPGAEVRAPRDREYGYRLRDPDDEHVLHAALMSGADAIVTDDQRAGLLESDIVREASIEILTGDEFMTNTVYAHHDRAVNAVLTLYRRRRNPPVESPAAILAHLCRSAELAELYDLLIDDLTE